jgi:hypothetical protein
MLVYLSGGIANRVSPFRNDTVVEGLIYDFLQVVFSRELKLAWLNGHLLIVVKMPFINWARKVTVQGNFRHIREAICAQLDV